MTHFQSAISFLLKYYPGLASGLFLTLCFPDTGWHLFAFTALVPWLISLEKLNSKEAFYSGFFMGMMHYTTLIYWIVPTVHIYGQLPVVLAVSTLVLLCCYLALYPAVFSFFIKKKPKGSLLSPLWAAVTWTGLEYLRTHAFTGFPWGALGYSQYSNLNLIQVADISGVLGVSFLIVFVNSSIAAGIGAAQQNRFKSVFSCVLCAGLLLSAALYYGHNRIRIVAAQMEKAPKTTISVVQGNVRQDLKWNQQFKQKTVEKYEHLSESVLSRTPDLVIWPETALPFYYTVDQGLSQRVDRLIRASKTDFLIGSLAFERDRDLTKFYNRAYMLNRFSIVTGTYDKTHLVPFGEYVPLGDYLPFLGKITAHAGNFSRGTGQFTPLGFKTHKTGVLICFEVLFPSIASNFVKNGADILTTLTNDAWFGYTSAARQHLSIAVFRAVENRRSLARAANTGISGFIDPVGQILDSTDLFKDQAIARSLPALRSLSVYTRYGDVFAVGCIVAFSLVFMLKSLKKS